MVALLTSPTLDPIPARAQGGCGRAGHPWVSVAFAGEAWSAELRRSVLADLRAGLALQGFHTCPVGTVGSKPPLAMIQLSAHDPGRVSVSIDVHDAITEKRVARDVDLSGVTPDSRALAVAVAADELLRASWAELALADAPEPAVEPPAEVERSVRASLSPELAPAPETSQRFGARFAAEHHGGGVDLLGGDLQVDLWLDPSLGLGLWLGAREGLTTDADNGRVESRALMAGSELQLALWSLPRRLWLWASLGASAASIELRGRADPSGVAKEGAGLSVHGRTGLGAALRLVGPLELRVDLGLGAPLSAVEAKDDARVATSTGGLLLHGGIGLGVRP